MSAEEFTEEQKQYLSGFAAGAGLPQVASSNPRLATFAATLGLPPASGKPPHGGEATRPVW